MQKATEKVARRNLDEMIGFKRITIKNENGLKTNNCDLNKRTDNSDIDDTDLLKINFRMKLYSYYDVFRKVILLYN